MNFVGKAVLIVIVAIQMGCSGMGKNELPPLSTEAQQRFSGITTTAALEAADVKLSGAYEQEMRYFAPQSLKAAEKALKAGRKLAENDKASDAAVFAKIVEMEAALAKAQITKTAVLRELEEVFALRADLDSINAKQYDKRRYEGLLSDIEDLIEYIEEGKSDKARADLPDITKELMQFEVDTIVYNALNPAKIALADAEDVDADKLAEKSFEQAEAIYTSAEAFIRANPKNDEAVQSRGVNALIEAKHAIFVAKMVASLQEIKPDKLESVVLDEERRLDRVTQALEMAPIHDRSVSDQALALADGVLALRDQLRQLEAKLKTVETELASKADAVPQVVDETQAVELLDVKAQVSEETSLVVDDLQADESQTAVESEILDSTQAIEGKDAKPSVTDESSPVVDDLQATEAQESVVTENATTETEVLDSADVLKPAAEANADAVSEGDVTNNSPDAEPVFDESVQSADPVVPE